MATQSYSVTIHRGAWAIVRDVDGWDYDVVEGGFTSLRDAHDRLSEMEAEEEAALRQEHSDIMDRLDEVSSDARAARDMLEFVR